MSLFGAVSNSVNALNAQNTALAVVSQNLANSQSTGYKAIDVQFSTILDQNSTDTSAYGVQANTRNQARNQGLIVGSGKSTDLAIDGKGFFVVNSSVDGTGSTYYTRNGALQQIPATALGGSDSSSGVVYLTDPNGNFLMGWPAGSAPSGTSNSSSGLSALSYDRYSQMLPQATTTIVAQGSVPSTTIGSTSTSLGLYDTSGNVQSLGLSLTPSGTINSWTLDFSMNASVGTVTSSSPTLTYDGNGKVIAPTEPVTVNIQWADGTSSNVSIDLSQVSLDAESEAASFKGSLVDGYTGGSFKSVSIDETGTVYANYTNNRSIAVGTLAVAQFVEPNELAYESGTLFSATQAAGAVSIGTVSSFGDQSTLVTASLENSTVDTTTEFATMITAQQAYQSASELWGVTTQMLETARDLIRN